MLWPYLGEHGEQLMLDEILNRFIIFRAGRTTNVGWDIK